MILAAAILTWVTAQRIGELILARRNTARLMASGAVEIGKSHYPYLVAMHAAWLLTIWALGLGQPIHFIWLALFCCLQVARVWVIATLGPRWTTRIIVMPGADLVKTGPYHFTPHPNYVVVCAEIAVFPMVFGLYWVAVVFSVLNALILSIRITIENRALASASFSASAEL